MFAPPISRIQTKAAASATHKAARLRSTLAARQFAGGAVERADMPQRGIGNRTPSGVGWDFNKIPIRPPYQQCEPTAP